MNKNRLPTRIKFVKVEGFFSFFSYLISRGHFLGAGPSPTIYEKEGSFMIDMKHKNHFYPRQKAVAFQLYVTKPENVEVKRAND